MRSGQVAAALGISRQHFNRLVKTFGLVPVDTSDGGQRYWDIETVRSALGADTGRTAPAASARRPLLLYLPQVTRGSRHAAQAIGTLKDLGLQAIDADSWPRLCAHQGVDRILVLVAHLRSARPSALAISDFADLAPGSDLVLAACKELGVALLVLPGPR